MDPWDKFREFLKHLIWRARLQDRWLCKYSKTLLVSFTIYTKYFSLFAQLISA